MNRLNPLIDSACKEKHVIVDCVFRMKIDFFDFCYDFTRLFFEFKTLFTFSFAEHLKKYRGYVVLAYCDTILYDEDLYTVHCTTIYVIVAVLS